MKKYTKIAVICLFLFAIIGLTACGNDVDFTVNFIVEGESYATISTAGNETIAMPDNPTKNGYSFDGWYWDEGVWQTPFTANSLLDAPLSSDMSVYAKFTHIHADTDWRIVETTAATEENEGNIMYRCAVCGAAKTETIDKLPHVHVYSDAWEHDATHHWHECAKDGDKSGYAEHVWNAGVVTEEATEEKTGIRTYTCTVCGATKTETIEKHTHVFSDWIVTHEPTCTQSGLKKRTCACGAEEAKVIKALEHDLQHHDAKVATCTEIGWNAFDTCSRCSYTTYEETPALEHDYDSVTTKPTCTEKGYTTLCCIRCNYTTYIEIPASGHHYEKDYKYATCVSIGETEYVCSVCQDRYKENTALLSCDIDIKQSGSWYFGSQMVTYYYSAGLSVSNVNGGIAPYVVSVLAIDLDEQSIIFNQAYYVAADFSFDQFLLSGTEYFANGSITSFNSATPAYKNVMYYITIQDQQGLQSQYSGYMYDIEEQDLTIIQSQYGSHQYEEWETTVNPTCTTSGERQQTCTRCNNVQTETLPALGHNYGEWTTASAPTCTNTGIETRKCSVCNTIERRSVSALGHNYGDWETTVEPTCTTSEDRQCVCVRCGNVQTETLSALGHSFGNWVVTKEATCQKGSKERTCSRCSLVETVEIPADYTAHVYEDDVCTICGEHKATEGLLYELLTSDTVAVSGYTGQDTIVYIPSSYIGATVTAIKANAFHNNTIITEIIIPDSVTNIGRESFADCVNLTSIIMSAAILSIGENAFLNCLPVNVTIPTIALSYLNKTKMESVILTNGTTIPSNAFAYSQSLKTITFGNNIILIEAEAFCDCYNLESVYYNGDITSWCNISFTDNSDIIRNNPLIYANNFYINNELVTELQIPDEVTEIKPFAFLNCRSLTKVTIGNGVKHIGQYAFWQCENLLDVILGDNVTTVGEWAFSYCTNLQKITLGKNLRTINDYAFGNTGYQYYGSQCTALREVHYTGDIASYCGITFRGHQANPLYYAHDLYINHELIQEIVLPNTISIIKQYTLTQWRGTSITISDSVTCIENDAFYLCGDLISVYYTGDIASWCRITFYDYNSNPLRSAHNLYIDNELMTEIVIPDTVTEIKAYAFYGWNGTSITIPDSVTSIGYRAFDGCSSLTSITIPDSVTIGEHAFFCCSSLTSVYYTGDIASWCGISFSGYNTNPLQYAHNLYINNELVTEIVIPDTVTAIKAYAFYGWNGTSITIPDSVTIIGEGAFYGCSRLTSVTFSGTKSKWNAIGKGSNWNYNTGSYTIYCTDGDIAK